MISGSVSEVRAVQYAFAIAPYNTCAFRKDLRPHPEPQGAIAQRIAPAYTSDYS